MSEAEKDTRDERAQADAIRNAQESTTELEVVQEKLEDARDLIESHNRSRKESYRRAERAEAALAEARGLEVRFVEAAEWYVRCLNDVIAQVPVRGLAEAEAEYKAAKIAISQFPVKP